MVFFDLYELGEMHIVFCKCQRFQKCTEPTEKDCSPNDSSPYVFAHLERFLTADSCNTRPSLTDDVYFPAGFHSCDHHGTLELPTDWQTNEIPLMAGEPDSITGFTG